VKVADFGARFRRRRRGQKLLGDGPVVATVRAFFHALLG